MAAVSTRSTATETRPAEPPRAEPPRAEPPRAEPPSAEPSPEPSGAGEVLVELGGNIGAAVLFTGPELNGEEIEIRPTGAVWSGTHVAVRERRLESGPRWAALFGSLPAGAYEVRLKGDPSSPILKLEVEGGHIAQGRWPTG
jgi:hypothetical protein